MKKRTIFLMLLCCALTGASVYYFTINYGEKTVINDHEKDNYEKNAYDEKIPLAQPVVHKPKNSFTEKPKPIEEWMYKGIDWLAKAQLPNGSWGAGLHARQNIKDPHQVQGDPATTAFAATALLRAGHTFENGEYQENVKKATLFLIQAVKNTPDNAANITTQTGTQPQRKLGANIDAAMTSQFLTRALDLSGEEAELYEQIENALEKCLRIIENSQQNDGSWNNGGWASVLNSAMANNSLEMAQAKGMKIDEQKLKASRDYQAKNMGTDGKARTESAAGIELYSISSSQRANAQSKKQVEKLLDNDISETEKKDAKKLRRKLEKNGVSEKEAEELAAGYSSYNAAASQINNDAVLRGFGNNGGEEFLSFMMTSESFITSNDQEQWEKWHGKMAALFENIQNGDGSWNGHHCITSPVFCTAAVLMTVTADRDELLAELAAN